MVTELYHFVLVSFNSALCQAAAGKLETYNVSTLMILHISCPPNLDAGIFMHGATLTCSKCPTSQSTTALAKTPGKRESTENTIYLMILYLNYEKLLGFYCLMRIHIRYQFHFYDSGTELNLGHV